ncbi:MAG: hypothetical protein MUF01_14620 [Bryobacterales bacterium]|jgi:hypothetical protein|nr:hypothetical protein [Bryobacterales bacterium]
MPFFCLLLVLVLALPAQQASQASPDQALSTGPHADADADGLPDSLEQALLERFLPRFHVSAGDCDLRPSRFLPGQASPRVLRQDGAIYGQASPSHAQPGALRIELRYYHLWGKDCGRFSHLLDVEQVAALVEFVPIPGTADGPVFPILRAADEPSWRWRALYWFAAGHQGTVCDVSHGARAESLVAEWTGPEVWVSTGKHASYLSHRRCRLGCGGDSCPDMLPLVVPEVINLGELQHPLNGSAWIAAGQWPLASKMKPLFTASVIAQIHHARDGEIVAVNRALAPMRATILAGGETLDGVAAGGKHSGKALKTSKRATGSALGKAFRAVSTALGAGTPTESVTATGDGDATATPSAP